MKIEFDKLKYVFQYTDWAMTPAFRRERDGYMTNARNGPQAINFEMPTPSPSVRTIGEWTLSKPLGRGGMGRVFLASNSKNQVAAVKVVEWNSGTKHSIDREIQTFRKLTALANERDAGDRIVRLLEVIGHPGDSHLSSSTPFQEVAMVMDPMTPLTLSNLVITGSDG